MPKRTDHVLAPSTATIKSKAPNPATNRLLIGASQLTQLVLIDPEGASTRSKRELIIRDAIERFGHDGYDATHWSAIASSVGIGQTALYHYFESKAHCLLVIMRLELARSLARFNDVQENVAEIEARVERSLMATFDISDSEVMQLRIVLSNSDILTNVRASAREEEERIHCLQLTRTIEDSWSDLIRSLYRHQQRRVPRNVTIISRSVLGLLNSCWRWYRPGGSLTTADLGVFYVAAAQRVLQV